MVVGHNKTMINLLNTISFDIESGGYAHLDKTWHNEEVCVPFNRLYIMESGTAFLHNGDQEITMVPNRAYLIPAGYTLGFHCDTQATKLFFHFNVLKQDGNDIFRSLNHIESIPIQQATLENMIHHYSQNTILDSLILKQMLLQIIMEFQTVCRIGIENQHTFSEHVLDTIRYIQENLSANLQVKDLADRRHISRSYLARRFRVEIGVSLNEYITDQKMMRAQWQLIQSDLSISEISRQLGFSDQFYFSRRFRQLYGVSPQRYRNRATRGSISVKSLRQKEPAEK